jgi:hypothetical protein
MRALQPIDISVVNVQLLAKYQEWVALKVAAGGMIGTYYREVGSHQVGTRPEWYSGQCTPQGWFSEVSLRLPSPAG